jgi:hypothetical protein
MQDVAGLLSQRRRFEHVVYADLRGACKGDSTSLRSLVHDALQYARVPGVKGKGNADLVHALTASPTLLLLDNIDSLLAPHGDGDGNTCTHCADLSLSRLMRDALGATSSSGALEPLKICFTACTRAVNNNSAAALDVREVLRACGVDTVILYPLTPENLLQVVEKCTAKYSKDHLGSQLLELAASKQLEYTMSDGIREEDTARQRMRHSKDLFDPEVHLKKV